jgi:hypothetical protein
VHQSAQPVRRIAGQRSRILPSLTEDGLHVADSRTVDRELHVMPRWPVPVNGRDRLGLPVPRVRGVVAAAVTQVDPADKCHVQLGAARMAQHDGLLMVRAAGPHPHVSQAAAARCLDVRT